MKAGIIAAGDGSRLREGGFSLPKPLVPVGGVPLIERVVRGLAEAGVDEVALIVNARMPEVAAFVRALPVAVPPGVAGFASTMTPAIISASAPRTAKSASGSLRCGAGCGCFLP